MFGQPKYGHQRGSAAPYMQSREYSAERQPGRQIERLPPRRTGNAGNIQRPLIEIAVSDSIAMACSEWAAVHRKMRGEQCGHFTTGPRRGLVRPRISGYSMLER
jgi:hypothetical protein